MAKGTDHRILVCGGGSIGIRHAKNARTLGVESIGVTEPVESRRNTLRKELSAETFADLPGAFKAFHPTVVFVCSPTKEHVPQALLALQSGADVFIEKPLSHSMEGVAELEEAARGHIVMVGCNMRFHPGPKKVKEWIDGGAVGTITHAQIYGRSYLPDWRPKSDYKKSYSADPVQGGVILDYIHEIDLALWYLGDAVLRGAEVKPATGIGLIVDGEAELHLEHGTGATSDVSLSFVKKGYERGCVIGGETGSITWDWDEPATLEKHGAKESFSMPEGFHPNQMYLDEFRYFLECVEGRTPTFSSLPEAKKSLSIVLAAKAHV